MVEPDTVWMLTAFGLLGLVLAAIAGLALAIWYAATRPTVAACACPAGSTGTYPNCTWPQCPACPVYTAPFSACWNAYPWVPTPAQLGAFLNPSAPAIPVINPASTIALNSTASFWDNINQQCQRIDQLSVNQMVGYIIISDVTDQYFSLGFYNSSTSTACAASFWGGDIPGQQPNWVLPWSSITSYAITYWTSVQREKQTCMYPAGQAGTNPQSNTYPNKGNDFYEPFYVGAQLWISQAGSNPVVPVTFTGSEPYPTIPAATTGWDPTTQLLVVYIQGSAGKYTYDLYVIPPSSMFSLNWINPNTFVSITQLAPTKCAPP